MMCHLLSPTTSHVWWYPPIPMVFNEQPCLCLQTWFKHQTKSSFLAQTTSNWYPPIPIGLQKFRRTAVLVPLRLSPNNTTTTPTSSNIAPERCKPFLSDNKP
ncbi:hypothetical protein PV05_08618 [Exophiala xenobiotica]|uniref:Uncharacterized protein n=1 Tax=Exophiala xenobiotica TaxID=348802 RepID=A0A0D2ECG9_9EURO|nr:uncharacterized protein PV05_08618 [Exophiala xenobiotica]KIW53013.1 hypothetical protein PV05_08618 [Exophiala xenobiotica]